MKIKASILSKLQNLDFEKDCLDFGHCMHFNFFYHFHNFQGLIEADKDLFLSGLLMNKNDENPQLKVHKIGPLMSWSKPYGKRSTLIILKTALQEYQLDSKEFSEDYSAALRNARFVENFFGSLPQNNVSQQKSPVTTVTNHNKPEIIDLDDEPKEIVSKSQKRLISDDEDDSPAKMYKSKTNSSKKSKTHLHC